ncbi:tetratricopeptide repeat protein [Neolewinella lacunae]|uniref:Tetratricopeptide repeat protein n=1 Tax=Neolewinella lacunae TaxID=1517758 RepID=A0A923PNH1_9BACT|nr:tetratricopeptide repeat protein [Neolewinella lacunae]MBC6995660.1 tetratricopeptide repeat protein [Neolewinella lacunae]MDN3634273.1 tetratricopeptide repeat protein [Neolewinella lacunae]
MLRYALFLAIALGSVAAFAQDESHIDSLEADLAARDVSDTLRIHTLINLWRATSNNDLERAEAYSRRIIAESQALNYPVGEATGYQRLGIVQDFLALKDSALANYAKAMAIYRARKMGRLEGIMLFNTAIIHQESGGYDTARHYLRLADERFADGDHPVERSAVNKLTAVIERQLGHPDQALVHARLAYDLARNAGDSSRMADAEQEIAFGYQALDDYRTAADFFRRCAGYYRRVEDDYFATVSLLNLATCFQSLGQVDEALRVGQEALAFATEGKFLGLELDVRNTLGNVYWENNDYERARQEFLTGLELARDQDNQRMEAELATYLTGVRLELGEYTAARQHGEAALALLETQGQLELIHRTHGHLATIAARLGDYPAAYQHLVVRQGLQDSLHRRSIADKVAELTLLFEKEKQDRLIGEQRARLSLLESQARANRLQKISLGTGLALVFVLLLAGWYSFRQRRIRLQLAREQLIQQVKDQQRTLSTHALQMAQKSRLLDQLGEELRQVKGERPDDRKKLDSLLRNLSGEERIDQDWENFRTYFQGVHGDFEAVLEKAAEQKLSPRELRLAALIKMQLNNQEIGDILGISQESLYKAKYRLRKKFPAAAGGELDTYLHELVR